MTGFNTETAQMQTAATHVADVTSRIGQLLNSLRAEVATAPTHFKGAAATTFTQLMAQYDTDAAQLNQALNGIADQIGAAGQTYSASDEAQSAALRGSGSGLNMS
jgi:WXG100 family type VII secretion target